MTTDFNKTAPKIIDNTEGPLKITLPWKTIFEGKIISYEHSNQFEQTEGWHIIVHNPIELPFFSSSYYDFFQECNRFFFIKIDPEMFLIDNDLKNQSHEKRGCFLQGEKNLIFFKKYTKQNCEHECLSFKILQTCDCVPFYVISEFYIKNI